MGHVVVGVFGAAAGGRGGACGVAVGVELVVGVVVLHSPPKIQICFLNQILILLLDSIIAEIVIYWLPL